MPTIYIDKQPYEVREGLNLLQACFELGLNLPYFCWHPAMGSVGACRQCAIKQFRDDKDEKGRIVMACMTPAADNTYISVEDPEAREFRTSITEWMMVNHPHDCPVCDEGGECHLQDMVVMTGHAYRRFRGKKRTFNNQNLGPFVNHEMNRCIQCYRCVRFYRDFAGGRDFNAFSLHDTVFFGRAKDGVLESEFSGNLVEVCPTGVFDDKTLMKHYTRKWDLQTAPSICIGCSVGCNTLPGERSGLLRRIRNRYNGAVNGYFLCDRGRYGYEFVNDEKRIRTARLPEQSVNDPKDTISEQVAEIVSSGAPVIGIGSPRASLESNFALRTLVGAENFYQGVSEVDQNLVAQIIEILQKGPAPSASLLEVALSDAVFVLGEDVSNTAPMIALALRQTVHQQPVKAAQKLHIEAWNDYANREVIQQEHGPFFSATPSATRIDDIAQAVYHSAPQDLARLGFAVAHELDELSAAVTDLSAEQLTLAKSIAQALREAEQPLIVSGSSCNNAAIIQAAANIAWALQKNGKNAKLSFVVPESNSLGVGLIGGKNFSAALQAIQNRQAAMVIVLENDLYRRASKEYVTELLNSAHTVIALDSLWNQTTNTAQVVLPAGTFAEASGTLVNQEGRAQRFYQVLDPQPEISSSWHWLRDIMVALGRPAGLQWHTLDDLMLAITKALPVFKPILDIAPPADFRMVGKKIPRQPARWSGRTAIQANISVHEPKPPDDPDTPLSFSMEGTTLQPPPALITHFWSPGWNSIQALNKFQSEIAGPLEGGNPGCRLIEPANGELPTYFSEIPAGFTSRADEWFFVPLYHVFGSEELSVLTPGIADLSPQPYVALHPNDFARLQPSAPDSSEAAKAPAENQPVLDLNLAEKIYKLPVKLDKGLRQGVAGLPVGLPGSDKMDLPGWGTLTHTNRSQNREEQPSE